MAVKEAEIVQLRKRVGELKKMVLILESNKCPKTCESKTENLEFRERIRNLEDELAHRFVIERCLA